MTLKIGKSKGAYYLVFQMVDGRGKNTAVPAYGPYPDKAAAQAELDRLAVQGIK